MSTNGTIKAIQQLDTPPNVAKPYVVPSLSGEIIYIPLSKSATRLLVTGKETDNAFAVVGSGGSQSDPIGFHFHHQAHDVFLCLSGKINVWANDKCRTMEEGDFASVPPGVVHQYQILGAHSEFLGLIVPGDWVDFFRFLGEPYMNGPLFPQHDDRNFFEVLLPKLKGAAEKYDMVPQPQYKGADPQAWTGEENTLPNGLEPYFLKNATGPAYVVEATVCRPLVTTKQSNNRFAIGSIEASGWHKSPLFERGKSIKFDVHHAVQVVRGKVHFKVGAEEAELSHGETVFIPAGTEFSYKPIGRLAKMYVFCNGGGLVELLCKLGKEHKDTLIPEKEVHPAEDLEKHSKEHGFSVV